MRIPIILTLLAAIATPAAAQRSPLMMPTRDVTITYRLVGGQDGHPANMEMSWMAARHTQRMEMPGTGWSVADHATNTGFIVMDEARRVMDMPASVLRRQLGAPQDAVFTREGTETVAGYSCTVWRYQDGANEGRVCLTSDGVMLRSMITVRGTAGGVEAVQVTYATQDPARFLPPAGYQRIPAPPPRERPAR
ncbi:MAG: hypothetical protein JWR10_2325 [Rubritepida sp.]|nr:hypothetical protein [Rubritepida sp.]